MNRAILVPTDFSEVAENASLYAISLAQQTGISKIIIFHSWQQPVVISPDMLTAELASAEIIREANVENLARIKAELQQKAGERITIETYLDYSEVTSGIEDYCRNNAVSFVVMGVTGGDLIDEKVFGSNAVTTARKIGTPIFVLPSTIHRYSISKVLLLTDYINIESSLPSEPISKLLEDTKAKFFIAHVDHSGSKIDDAVVEADNKYFSAVFGQYKPEFHILHQLDYVDAVNEFVAENGIDLVIAMPKKKSFWQSIFSPSRTKQLAFNGKTPMLVLQPKA